MQGSLSLHVSAVATGLEINKPRKFKMDLTACHHAREPGVIDEAIIYNAIIEQGPIGEEGRLFKEQGIIYEEIMYLRLEFLDILKIDHLWMMTGLRKLQLSNNIIEVIENLDMLVNLVELDLSFNNIAKIEKLDTLTRLEVLTLFQNRITTIENLESLKKLTVFSIGNNLISDHQNVIYLRQFETIRSFNMAGNPLTEMHGFNDFIYAHLPQLIYYEYRMIKTEHRDLARARFEKELVILEREEAGLRDIEKTEQMARDQEVINTAAFVEYLGGKQLFTAMFDGDPEGTTLLQMSDEIREFYHEFINNFTVACTDLHQLGLHHHTLRKQEMKTFDDCINADKEVVLNESRSLLEQFLEQKKKMFRKLKGILQTEEEEEAKITQLSHEVQEINDSFQELCLSTWHDLMKQELYLLEAMEEVNSNYERALTELVNQFTEAAQAQFTVMRSLQNSWNETIVDAGNKFITNLTVTLATGSPHDAIPYSKDLLHIMSDKEILNNAIASSHDYHLLIIDQREDKLVSSVKEWLTNFVHDLTSREIKRNRDKVIEINHFLDGQKEELEEMTATPLGLMLLPKEVQDALQIS